MTERELERPTNRVSKVFVVFNPMSGRASPADLQSALDRRLDGAGIAYEIYEIKNDRHDQTVAAIRQALQHGCDLVVAVGGDGTISTVADALAGSGVPMAVVAAGTANVFARELGIPLGLDEAIALIGGEFSLATVDAMQVGERYAILQIGIGVDALMIRDTPTASKSRYGRLAYLWTALGALFGFQPQRFNLVIDGQRRRLSASQVLLANGGVLGVEPLRWGPNIRPDDGLIDVCVVNASTLTDYLGVLWHTVIGQHHRDRRLRYFQAREQISVNVRRALPIQADGEMIGKTPLQVRVVPGALRVVVPILAPAVEPVAPLPAEEPIDPLVQAEVAPVEPILKEKLRQIKSPAQAAAVADELITRAGDKSEKQIREQHGPAQQPAREIERKAAQPGVKPVADTLVEAARQVAASEGEQRVALEQVVSRATNPEIYGALDPDLAEPLDLLREAILHRMRPWQALDTRIFLAINHLPHSQLSNQLMYGVTTVMNAGFGWVLGLLAAAAFNKSRGIETLREVVPPLWFATMMVEYPIKTYFRRTRPFIDVVKAISVGRKPGSYSFPSGHSAAAFAGAWLLSRHYPKLIPLWYTIATSVGFSRIYLGAHYPSDVLSGAITGVAIAEITRRVID